VTIATLVRSPDPTLFFSRDNPADPRMGDLVLRGEDAATDETRVAVIGVPQHIGVLRNGGRGGAAFGPDAIRSMLYRLTAYDVGADRAIPARAVVDLGNVICQGELEEIHDRVERVVAEVRTRDWFPLVLGGGHDITYPVVRGSFGAGNGGGLVNIDAHLDVRPPGNGRNSGTSIYMLIDEETISAERTVEVGIQNYVNAADHARWFAGKGGTIVTLDEIRSRGFNETIAAAKEIAVAGAGPVHATLDMDSVTGASAPGVSAVLPDGLTPQEFVEAARQLAALPTVVSMGTI
jgi:arginase family enzyme